MDSHTILQACHLACRLAPVFEGSWLAQLLKVFVVLHDEADINVPAFMRADKCLLLLSYAGHSEDWGAASPATLQGMQPLTNYSILSVSTIMMIRRNRTVSMLQMLFVEQVQSSGKNWPA